MFLRSKYLNNTDLSNRQAVAVVRGGLWLLFFLLSIKDLLMVDLMVAITACTGQSHLLFVVDPYKVYDTIIYLRI